MRCYYSLGFEAANISERSSKTRGAAIAVPIARTIRQGYLSAMSGPAAISQLMRLLKVEADSFRL